MVIAISTTFNAITVAMPKLFAERLADLTNSPALLGVIAAGVYVFGAMTQYTIGKLIDHYSLKTVMLPLSFVLAPFLYFAATLSNLPLIIASIGIVMGAFGQVTVNDAMVGKYTSEEWRSRAYSVRYFIGFTAAGASVGLVAWLYEKGGFVTMLQAFGALCLLVIVAAIILPQEIKVDSRISSSRRPSVLSSFFTALDAAMLPWLAEASWFFSISSSRERELTMTPADLRPFGERSPSQSIFSSRAPLLIWKRATELSAGLLTRGL